MKQQISNLPLKDLITVRDTIKAELSFYEFFKQAWPYIEGGKPFIDGWHIHAISEHLEAVANRQIKNLIINIPPRCGKSGLVSVAFPAWRWIIAPHEQFLYASFAQSLSIRDSRRCRTLISSSWYQERWGNRFKLLKDQNTKSRFDNTQKGYRLACSTGGSITGEGGSIILCDDPNNAKEGESVVQRETKIDWWTQVWSTRLNDKANDCRVIIQQRLHERDITGYVLDHDELGEWTKLILPMEFEEKRCAITVPLPSTEGKAWRDPRTKEGDLLWPEKIGAEDLKSLKASMGSIYAISGQLQQRPSAQEGGIFKRDDFQVWKSTELPDIEFTLQSWDTAFSQGKNSSYSACTTWGVFYDENYIENVILLSMWRGRVEYPELRERAKRLYFDYRDIHKEKAPNLNGRPLDLVLIEAKATGDPLIRDLARGGIRALPVNPSGKGDKVKRACFITPLVEGKRVWLPARPPAFDLLLPFADEFLESVANFRHNSDDTDLTDTMSQALTKLKTGLFLHNPHDDRPSPPSQAEPVVVY